MLVSPATHCFPSRSCIRARRARQDKARIKAIEACIASTQRQDGFVTVGAKSKLMKTNADPACFPFPNAANFFCSMNY